MREITRTDMEVWGSWKAPYEWIKAWVTKKGCHRWACLWREGPPEEWGWYWGTGAVNKVRLLEWILGDIGQWDQETCDRWEELGQAGFYEYYTGPSGHGLRWNVYEHKPIHKMKAKSREEGVVIIKILQFGSWRKAA